ncbi:PREDICTED: uncharacterized protein LOC109130881 [Camelina sativa]|uniref:Uncharacterized protein LOC109130881 n=1 Tax=Camelina sativa TaxID=90675 RepID=A0ABM1RBX0_CAMSA|nr:PREDICTED: uncharacterized protein LOC109130881 [Camelina sativa]
MNELRECVQTNELSDMPSRGAFFTWFNGRQEDPILRKLDMVLVNETWRTHYPEAITVIEAPGDSDHSPCIVYSTTRVEQSKKPFKYFSFLSTHPRFRERIRDAWQRPCSVGTKLFTMGQKFKMVKEACMQLNREGYGNIQQRAKEALEKLEEVQAALLTTPSDSLFRQEFLARKAWHFFEKTQESFYKQKSRIRWYKDRDANTAFFHRYVLENQGRNGIKHLRGMDDDLVHNMAQVKDMLCGSELASQLLQIPTIEEIQRTIVTMPKNKAPRPDGFPVEFIWEAWGEVGSVVVEVFQDFFRSCTLPKSLNATINNLIPKVSGADRITQFRPVSCCNTVYKIISLLLKQKMKLFVSDAVQSNRVGFIQGRYLCENVLLAYELVTDFHVRGDTTRGCLQVDIAKAYDNVDWQFMLNVLHALDLPQKFIEWLKVCFTTPSFRTSGIYPGKETSGRFTAWNWVLCGFLG